MQKIKNLRTTSKALLLGTATSFTLMTSLTGCGFNKQVVDFNKSFNIAIEKNDDAISVIGIKKYADYSGSMVQVTTNNGLIITESTSQTQLVKSTSKTSTDNYVNSLTDNSENITYVGDINYDSDLLNKKIADLNYEYNKAIIVSNDTATIVNLDTWRDYDEDDKIQVKLEDGTCILTNADKIKLVNDKDADEGSIEEYAQSLVGSKEKVLTYKEQSSQKQKEKTK